MQRLRLGLTGLLAVVVAWLIYDSWPVAEQGNAYATVVLGAAIVLLIAHGIRVAFAGADGPVPHFDGLLRASLGQKLRFAAFVGAWIGYLVLFPLLGFTVSTFLVLLASQLLGQHWRLVVAVPAAAIFTLVFTVLLKTIFYIPLPESAVDRWIDVTIYRLLS